MLNSIHRLIQHRGCIRLLFIIVGSKRLRLIQDWLFSRFWTNENLQSYRCVYILRIIIRKKLHCRYYYLFVHYWTNAILFQNVNVRPWGTYFRFLRFLIISYFYSIIIIAIRQCKINSMVRELSWKWWFFLFYKIIINNNNTVFFSSSKIVQYFAISFVHSRHSLIIDYIIIRIQISDIFT